MNSMDYSYLAKSVDRVKLTHTHPESGADSGLAERGLGVGSSASVTVFVQEIPQQLCNFVSRTSATVRNP